MLQDIQVQKMWLPHSLPRQDGHPVPHFDLSQEGKDATSHLPSLNCFKTLVAPCLSAGLKTAVCGFRLTAMSLLVNFVLQARQIQVSLCGRRAYYAAKQVEFQRLSQVRRDLYYMTPPPS
jgi:hypothetical protein